MTSPSGPSRDDLGDSDLVLGRPARRSSLVAGHDARQLVDPRQAEVADRHARLLVCRVVALTAASRPRRSAAPGRRGRGVGLHLLVSRCARSALVTGLPAASPAHRVVLVGARPARRAAAARHRVGRAGPRRPAAREGARAVGRAHVRRADGAVDGRQRDVRHRARRSRRRARAAPTASPSPVAFDLEWYATGEPTAAADGYAQDGVVHGTIELAGGPLHLTEVAGRRWHRWGDDARRARCCPTRTPTPDCGRRSRSPTATVADWVLTPDGWRSRVRGD